MATPLLHMAVQCERHLCVPLKFSGEPAVKAFLTPLFHLYQIYLIYHLFLDSPDTEYEHISFNLSSERCVHCLEMYSGNLVI